MLFISLGYAQEDLKKLKLEGCIKELEKHDDFANEKSMLENYIKQQGHQCFLYLSTTVSWTQLKGVGVSQKYIKSHCNYSITGLTGLD